MFAHGYPSSWEDPKWYVLFVRSNQERMVTHHLKSRDVEHYLAGYSTVRRWKDRRCTLEMPLFPGYVFVRLPLLQKMKVLTFPPVVSLAAPKESPTFIPIA